MATQDDWRLEADSGHAGPPLLEVRGISKRFPGVRALNHVNLNLHRGEVLAVIGENGAGKSTLMKILAGVQLPDEGEVLVEDRPVVIDSVERALGLGISLIHQELNLADNLSVGENIFLGREPLRWGFLDHAKIYREASVYLKQVGLDIEPTYPTHLLSIGQQQLVEIAKALSTDARVLIMDEPTSSLSQYEADRLYEVIQELRDRGVSIVYISHRLGEVKRLADRVLVLRDGQNAAELSKEKITHDAMVRHMVGRDVSQFFSRQPHELGEVVLKVSDVRTEANPTHEISFEVRAGEIVGIAGLVGAGRTELLNSMFGVERRLSGEVFVQQRAVQPNDSTASIQAGLSLVPEDRKQQGLVTEMSVRHNISLASLRRFQYAFGWLNARKETELSREMTRRLAIKTPSADQIAMYLSGGNQQKVALAKWLALSPQVLMLDEPTRGIDVGAKQEIYQLMHVLAGEGVAILFVSSEMEEILGVSDRVLVMHEGEMTGELPRESLSEEAVMHLATGQRDDVVAVASHGPAD